MFHFVHNPIGAVLSILCLIFWIVMLVDCLQNQRLNSTEKLIWVLVLIFLPLLGAILYFVIARKR